MLVDFLFYYFIFTTATGILAGIILGISDHTFFQFNSTVHSRFYNLVFSILLMIFCMPILIPYILLKRKNI